MITPDKMRAIVARFSDMDQRYQRMTLPAIDAGGTRFDSWR